MKVGERGALLVSAAALLSLQIALFHGVRLDDAYITFRYGVNLARGAGLVFNEGERVMGLTSPGESLLSGLVYLFAGKSALPVVMASLGCVGWTLQAVMLFRILRGTLGLFGASVVGLAVAVGAAGSAPWTPLETNLTVGLALLALHLALSSRWLGAAIACAGATLMRPDVCLVALPLLALAVRERRRDAWKPALLYVVLLLPWVVFAWRYFGSPIPQSAVRKVNREGLAAYAEHVATYLPLPYEGVTASRLVWPLWLLAIGGGVTLARRDRRLFVLAAYGALHVAAYLVLRPDTSFRWHLYPAAVVFVALEIAALVSLAGRMRIAGTAGASVIVGYALWSSATFAIDAPHLFWFGRRDALYRHIAAYLRPRADPGDIVAAEEVGTVGYFTDLEMNDNAGLITREPTRLYHQFIDGKPTRLRWLVLNDQQFGTMAPVFQRRVLLPFEVEGTRLYLVDLRTPNLPPP